MLNNKALKHIKNILAVNKCVSKKRDKSDKVDT
jgi:hypothetical protein